MNVTYDYAIVRVVPRVERGEFVNAGVIVSCDAQKTIDSKVELDEARVLALDPRADIEAIRDGLGALVAVCRGDAGAGTLASMTPRERFHWLVAPRSAVIQTSPVHTGRAADVTSALAKLFDAVVRIGPVREQPSPTRTPGAGHGASGA